jgi:hypothetical protein
MPQVILLFNHDFADCSEAQQKQILDRIAYQPKAAPQHANAVAFFNHLRDLVVSGFFSSKMGVKDLPYLGNTMVADWQGCPPPRYWPSSALTPKVESPEALVALATSPDGTSFFGFRPLGLMIHISASTHVNFQRVWYVTRGYQEFQR